MFSALLTLKGHVYEALDNRNFATDCYKEAVLKDINCFEALNSLLQHQLLTNSEGNVDTNPISPPPPFSPTGAMFIFTTIRVSLIS